MSTPLTQQRSFSYCLKTHNLHFSDLKQIQSEEELIAIIKEEAPHWSPKDCMAEILKCQKYFSKNWLDWSRQIDPYEEIDHYYINQPQAQTLDITDAYTLHATIEDDAMYVSKFSVAYGAFIAGFPVFDDLKNKYWDDLRNSLVVSFKILFSIKY